MSDRIRSEHLAVTEPAASNLDTVLARAQSLREGPALRNEVGRTLDGRYEIVRELARGSMGVVYEARDLGLQRRVAVKIIAPDLERSKLALDRFRREAAALALVRSPYVVQVHAFGPHDEGLFFVMEYVAGRDLESIVRDHNDHHTWMPLATSLTILQQVSSGLSAVHAAGLVHRDVKPANIVVESATGRPMLIDFGLARALAREGDDPGRLTTGGGTPWYMPPEQAADTILADALSPASDVYALACTGFEMLTGHPPFEGTHALAIVQRHLTEDAPLLSSIRPELRALDPVFERALAKAPSDRYPDAGAFAVALARASGGLAVPRVTRGLSADSIPPPPVVGGQHTEPARVLVVDDDDAFRKYATRACQIAFFGRPVRVASAASGVSALESVRRRMPHMLILDYDMPGIDGIDTLAHVRAMERGHDVRVLVASAKATDVERWRFAALGVDDFVRKPIEMSGLVAAITTIAEANGWQPAAS